jgi:predicted AAA+ superfamily ATPase
MYIQRKIQDRLLKHIERKEYTIITGARQTGKTTLLTALYDELKQRKQVTRYITFEDMDVLNAIDRHPEEIFSFVPRPVKGIDGINPEKQPYFLFIDEVQYAANPSNFLKYLYDTYAENLKIIATGSSAFYIDKKFRDSLSGRKRIFELKTLDFEEWLTFRKKNELLKELIEIKKRDNYISAVHRELMEMFDEYLVYGGYPAVVLEDDKNEKINLLKDIKNSFLKRDIDESGINIPDKFYALLTILAGQTGNLINKNELATTLGIDNNTIGKYLYVMQNCFHIQLLKPFYSNLRKELTKMPKVYFNDPGMRNVALNRFFDFKAREDRGSLLENYAFNRLTSLYDTDAVRYWRTADGKEVDFVITTSYQEGLAYEVKMNCRAEENKSFKKFTETYTNYPLEIISYNIREGCKWILKL